VAAHQNFRAVRVDALQYHPVVGDEALGQRPMLFLEFLQLLVGPFGQGGHPAAEHLRDVVAGPGPRGEHHRREQRRLLRAAVVAEHRGIGDLGLSGEVGQLRRGNPATRGTGNDGPVSTATASSFLNAAGTMGG
jgi:hypothetical protein